MEKHGKTGTVEYEAWLSMKKRCLKKACNAYPGYGGRGITICKEWLTSFSSFLKDVGKKPDRKMSLDRINCDGNYEPKNVRWATLKTQNRNFSDRKSPLGIRGVRLLKGRYYAYIHVDRAQIALGGFDNFFDAICARKSAENTRWGTLLA